MALMSWIWSVKFNATFRNNNYFQKSWFISAYLFWFVYMVKVMLQKHYEDMNRFMFVHFHLYKGLRLWEFEKSSTFLRYIFEYHGWHSWTSNNIFRKSFKIPWKSSNFKILEKSQILSDFLHFMELRWPRSYNSDSKNGLWSF